MGAWRWAPPLAAAAAVVIAALKLLAPYGALPPCLFRMLTGWPCPSCGGTRCVLALTALDLPGAAANNPLVLLAAVGLAVALLLDAGERILHRPLLSPEPLLRRPAVARTLAVALVLANWVYLILAERG
ncbi:MAG TPA: DUF2752 domain-containing protein [Armatimonadota bacterium]|nr:DUF2752 domain-containing protein [Armatimonadota bacterium]HOM82660.1 DUF2752 domain-containing protein [Armatimonadota bacterium]HPO72581.1 DUF2752 domain-containing protein [Armatimonadota bacterium]HPT97907.1 DUF2752 domain-containing protein [Armatimonadota bacterium]